MRAVLLGAVALSLLACGAEQPPPSTAASSANGPADPVAAIVASEAWLRATAPSLQQLGPQFLSGQWSESPTVVRTSAPIGMGLTREHLDGGFGDAVRTLLQLDDASISFADARQTPDGGWEADLVGMARGTGRDGAAVVLTGTLTGVWAPTGALASLKTTTLERTRAPRRLFREVRGDDALEGARRSRHEEAVRELVRDGEDRVDTPPHFEIAAFDRHPGLSVVDVDGDGWDDLYVMAR